MGESSPWKLAVYAVVLAFLLFQAQKVLLPVLSDIDSTQWDFEKDYYGAVAYSRGYNPYHNSDLARVSGKHMALPYVYPPLTIGFYRLFAFLRYDSAQYVFLALKALLLVGLMRLWGWRMVESGSKSEFAVFTVLAYNSTALIDLHTGNVAMLEQALLWLGFHYYLKGDLMRFTGFTLAAASFKVLPIAFLGLLLFSDDDRRHKYLLTSAAIFMAYLLLPAFLMPGLFDGYVRNLEITIFHLRSERGMINPSTLALVKDLTVLWSFILGLEPPANAHLILYLAMAAAVVSVSARAVSELRRRNDRRMLLFFLVLVYALLAPRMKDYGYVILIPSTFYAAGLPRFRSYRPLILLAGMVPVSVLQPHPEFLLGMWGYYALAYAYLIWVLYVIEAAGE
ncbi:MAG: DUF2029 domain-containing protein [Candidatus Altiarchaeales archaeon]|nr:DUF2029 domain-containing protein [Candidatus Altiarchaeales archaeon]MBD3416191.1 DUF2029 domain-containing protein [Candidatus Altiarchaeales archaeon]